VRFTCSSSAQQQQGPWRVVVAGSVVLGSQPIGADVGEVQLDRPRRSCPCLAAWWSVGGDGEIRRTTSRLVTDPTGVSAENG
jgi:hypothetical protein